jgi:hypothetical protein
MFVKFRWCLHCFISSCLQRLKSAVCLMEHISVMSGIRDHESYVCSSAVIW